MQNLWSDALWPQFGAAIDTLEAAVMACPDALWRQRLWTVPPDQDMPQAFSEFWYLTYHALLWLDLYLSGDFEGFAPSAPVSRYEIDSDATPPERPYTREELLAYLDAVRQRGRALLSPLTEQRAAQPFEFPWEPGHVISYLELQLYNLRHLQEHAAQLNLLLGQHATPDITDWVMWARDESASK